MRLGHLQFDIPFCQAGLAGYSDRAMRLVARRRGCPYAVTEALLDIIMLAGGLGLKRSIDISAEDHPVAGQIIGSEPATMAKAAVILARAGYDVIDLNFACPVKKIRNKSRGGHMLGDVGRAVEILKSVRDAVPERVPTTLSLRRGFDDSAQSAERFFAILDAAWSNGYAAARVHGRSVEQKYLGKADWSFLAGVKKRYPDQVIFGSGDVFTAEDAVRMLRQTHVDMIWIARGAIGNPWIFRDAATLWKDPAAQLTAPTLYAQRDALAEHFALAIQIHGEELAGRRMRKAGIKYSRFHPNCQHVKNAFIAVRSLRDWTAVLNQWYSSDGPGVWPRANAADEVNDSAETADAANPADPACSDGCALTSTTR